MRTDPPYASLVTLRSLLEELEHDASVATMMVRGGHRVDLTGFDARIGSLCARTLALPIEQGRLMRPDLMRLQGTLEALDGGLRSASTA